MLDLPTVNTTRLSSFNSNKDIFQVKEKYLKNESSILFLILHNISLDQIRLCMLISRHYPLKAVFAKHEGGYVGIGKVT